MFKLSALMTACVSVTEAVKISKKETFDNAFELYALAAYDVTYPGALPYPEHQKLA